MSFRQVYYTSCRSGLRGSPGFQVNAATPGIAPTVLSQVERLGVYVPPVSAPSRPGPAELPQFPLALIHQRLLDGTMVLAQSRYIGTDYSGRFGNYFAHSLVSTAPDTDLGDLLPIQLWRSPFWGATESATPELPECQPPGSALDLPQVVSFLAQNGRLEHVAAFITAAQQSLRTKRRIVIVDSSDSVASWIAAICFVLPRQLARQLTFNTYVKSPYQTDALVVGTTADSDFEFAPHEIQHTVFLFDFVGGRFTPVGEPSPLGRIAESLFRAADSQLLAGFYPFIAGVDPQVLLPEADVALATYCGCLKRTVPGIDGTQIAPWVAPRLARLPTAQVGPLFTHLLAGPATAPAIEVALLLMEATLAKAVPRETRIAAVAVGVGWTVNTALRTVSTPALAKIIAGLSAIPELRTAAPLHPIDWSALLGSTTEPVRVLLYMLLGQRLGCLDDLGDTLGKIGEAVVGPALATEPVQRIILQLAASGRPVLAGVAEYLLGKVREPGTFLELGPLLASDPVASALQDWALAHHAELLYFHLTTGRARQKSYSRADAFKQCLEGVASTGDPITGPLIESAVAVIWPDEKPTFQEALQILAAAPPETLAQTPIPVQLAERLALSLSSPIESVQHELAGRLGAPVLRAALGPEVRYLEVFAAAVQLNEADWGRHLVSALRCAEQAGQRFSGGICRLAAQKLANQLDFPLHANLLTKACAASPWFGAAYLAAMEDLGPGGFPLAPQTVVSLLQCWLALSRIPAHEHIAGLLIDKVLLAAMRGWGRKQRALAKAAIGADAEARDRLRAVLSGPRKRWKRLFFRGSLFLGTLLMLATLATLWLRYGRQQALPKPTSPVNKAPPRAGTSPTATATQSAERS